jgi:hypothetical protein
MKPKTLKFKETELQCNANSDRELSGYAENPDKWIFLYKYATLAV